MESEQKNSYLFYLIITLILLGFIASLALPLKDHDHRLSDYFRRQQPAQPTAQRIHVLNGPQAFTAVTIG